VALGVWIVGAGVVLGVFFHSLLTEDDTVVATHAPRKPRPVPSAPDELPTKTNASEPARQRIPSATGGGSNGTTPRGGSVLSSGAQESFTQLESSLSAQVGVAVAPFGSAPPQQFGSLETGHAWSSFKVPIVVTVMREQGGLTAEDEGHAAAAITASDNEAAAALFSQLGDVGTASAAVEGTLAEAGYPTEVATGPPPSGAVSTWGQTQWPLVGSVYFYRALACGRLLSPEATQYVLGLMESVIPEQQWGLGEAGISGQVAIKGGWGPDGSSSGPYLVRQAGVLRLGSSGAVVTIAAQDDSGSFEAGVQDLNAVAAWVRDNVRLEAGTCAG
jgi:hypothetical protein